MSSNLDRRKIRVGQLVLATEAAAYLNRGPTYVVVEILPGFYCPTDPIHERPCRIRQLTGKQIPLSRGVELGFYASKSSWARECQLQAIPADEGASFQACAHKAQTQRHVNHWCPQDEQTVAFRPPSDASARRSLDDASVW